MRIQVWLAKIGKHVGKWKLAASRRSGLPFVFLSGAMVTAAMSIGAAVHLFESGYSAWEAGWFPEALTGLMHPWALASVCALWPAAIWWLCKAVDDEKLSEAQIEKARQVIAEASCLKERRELEDGLVPSKGAPRSGRGGTSL